MSEESKPAILNVKDLAGLSAPLTKLIETVGAGGGRLADGVRRIVSAYWLVSKDARNEAERIRLVEGAKTQTMSERAKMLGALARSPQRELKGLDINAQGEVSAQLAGIPSELQDLHERSARRAAYENMVQQLNWDAVTGFAAEALSQETTVAQEPVDQDWTTRLRSISQDVSSEEMQALWGNILAGEIKQPGSYSLRTLEVLQNLTQREAELFRIAANFTVRFGGACRVGISRYGYHEMVSARYGFDYQNLMALIDCGLVSSNDGNIGIHTGQVDESTGAVDKQSDEFQIGNQVLVVQSDAPVSTHYNVYPYTKAGNELYGLVASNAKLPISFLVDFTKPMRTEGMQTFYAELIRETEDGSFVYAEPLIEIPKETPDGARQEVLSHS
ncbi:DUF2806 domain-containing protein [Hymenobacter terrenus]|uniref:DUF2806 domain-containing protein n=1 Tax=Hymenobacter terrenus TaxID=1629124 RepID=UPI0006964DE3|nr:DUF2806 domain-containing protein [Hymenobacter terrenus]